MNKVSGCTTGGSSRREQLHEVSYTLTVYKHMLKINLYSPVYPVTRQVKRNCGKSSISV
jgi:hypothetical protein